jgi:hypothetical protein
VGSRGPGVWRLSRAFGSSRFAGPAYQERPTNPLRPLLAKKTPLDASVGLAPRPFGV